MSDNLGNNQACERDSVRSANVEHRDMPRGLKILFDYAASIPSPGSFFGMNDIAKLKTCQVPYISDIRLYNAIGLAVLGQVETGNLSTNFARLILVLCMQLIDLDKTSFRFDKFKSQFDKAKSDVPIMFKEVDSVINAFADSLGLRRCDEYVSDNNSWRDGGECDASVRMKNLSELKAAAHTKLKKELNVMFLMELRAFPLSNSVWSGIWNYLLAGQEESQRHQILQRTDRNDRLSKYLQLVQGDPYSTAVMIQSLCCLLVRCGCRGPNSLANQLLGGWLIKATNRIYGLSIHYCKWNLDHKAYNVIRKFFAPGYHFLPTILLGLHNLDPEGIEATEVANAIELRNYCFGKAYKFHGMKVLNVLRVAITTFHSTAEEILETCRFELTSSSVSLISKFLRHIEECPDTPRCWVYARAFHPNYFSYFRDQCHSELTMLLVELVGDKQPGIEKLVFVKPAKSAEESLVRFAEHIKSKECLALRSSGEEEGEGQTMFKKFAQLAFEEKAKTVNEH